MRKGSALGFVVLLLAMAVAVLLTLRAWEAAAPTALDVAAPDRPAGRPAAEEPNGGMPGLREMKQATSAHADEAAEALRESD